LPGERVRVQARKTKKDYSQAQLLEVLSRAPERVAPICPHFGECGGCQWQHTTYDQQLAWKRKVVVDQLRRIGGFAEAEELVRPTVGMVDPWEYRNHVRFSLGKKYGDVGYTQRETHRLLRIDYCHIAMTEVNQVLDEVQRRCAGLQAHQIMVRYGSNTGDLLINPVLPMLPTLPSGQPGLRDQILDRTYHISTAAFFQVNTKREARRIPDEIEAPWIEERNGMYSIADLLALTVLDRLRPEPDDVVADAYCGVGTFTALIAPHVREVIGIEESTAATKDAVRNTEDLSNARFLVGKSEDVITGLEVPNLDAVVLDPARVGCAPPLIGSLLERKPRRIVYVSCDPATLARDLRLLHDGGYQVHSTLPLDMFPQTYHVETVTRLTYSG
jgi:23S rRNA (uracil1939-C5)-methyltransferase